MKNLENFFKIEGMPCRPIISLRNLRFSSMDLNLINLELIKKLAEKNILYNGSVFICKTHTFKDLRYFANSFEDVLEDIKNKYKL